MSFVIFYSRVFRVVDLACYFCCFASQNSIHESVWKMIAVIKSNVSAEGCWNVGLNHASAFILYILYGLSMFHAPRLWGKWAKAETLLLYLFSFVTIILLLFPHNLRTWNFHITWLTKRPTPDLYLHPSYLPPLPTPLHPPSLTGYGKSLEYFCSRHQHRILNNLYSLYSLIQNSLVANIFVIL